MLLGPLGASWELSGPILSLLAELCTNFEVLRPYRDSMNMKLKGFVFKICIWISVFRRKKGFENPILYNFLKHPVLYRVFIKNGWLYYTLFYIIFFLLFVCDFCHIYLCFVTKWFKHVKIQIIIVQKLGHVTHQKFKICKIKDYKTSKVFCLDLHKESLELYEI